MAGMKTLMSLINSKVESLPVEESFLNDLKTTVAKMNPQTPSSPYFKPSSLNCMRLMYFDKIQAKKDSYVCDYSDARIPETGTASHEAIQYYVSNMKNCGLDCEWVDIEEYIKTNGLDYLVVKSKKEYETKLFDTRYNISFLCDGVIKYKGKYYILEIKTETDFKGANRDSADANHRRQSVCYSLCLGIKDIMWLYEERNFCTPKTFHTVVTDEEISEILLVFETVENAVKEMIPPSKPESKRSCQYCAYTGECKKWK